jgi:cell filamentation protein
VFDPFKDFDTAGYLRNTAREKNPAIVKQIEHALFAANVQDAINYLNKKRAISYNDFLMTHQILFSGFYPWAGQDRAAIAADIAISKAGTMFAHPADAKRAVEEGLRIGSNKKAMRQSPGLVMGLFAYGHPFLDGNGRTMLVVHMVLCNRAGFSINWGKTNKDDYLRTLSKEIATPDKGTLDAYLNDFIDNPLAPGLWGTAIESIKGLDGRNMADTIDGTFSDPSISQKYREFDRQRRYEISPHPGVIE